MFPLFKRDTNDKPQSTGNQLFKRFLALGAGLLLLWLALNIMPRPSAATQPVTFSDDAGTVATSSKVTNTESGAILDIGKITAGLLLAGLIGFAFYWQKKSSKNLLTVNSLHSLGKIQLSPNQHVHLIGCGPDALLVGTNNAQITLLHQLSMHDLEDGKENSAVNAPQYCAPSSTLQNNPNFGVLLQQQNLTTQSQLEAIKNL